MKAKHKVDKEGEKVQWVLWHVTQTHPSGLRCLFTHLLRVLVTHSSQPRPFGDLTFIFLAQFTPPFLGQFSGVGRYKDLASLHQSLAVATFCEMI